MDETRTHYQVLEVAESATAEQITAAHRKLLARYHSDRVEHLPDTLQWVKNEAKTQREQIDHALHTLLDPRKRQQYDQALQERRTRYVSGGDPGRAMPDAPSYTSAATAASSSSIARRAPRGIWSAAFGCIAGVALFYCKTFGWLAVLVPAPIYGPGWLALGCAAGCAIFFGIATAGLLRGLNSGTRTAARFGLLLLAAGLALVAPAKQIVAVNTNPEPSPTDSMSPSAPKGTIKAPKTSLASSDDALDQVAAAVANWRNALLSNDPRRLANCYAANLDRYLLQVNVTRQFVRQYFFARHDRGDVISSAEIFGLNLRQLSNSGVEAQAVEVSDSLTAGQRKHETTRVTLHFTREGGAWKISYESRSAAPSTGSEPDSATTNRVSGESGSSTASVVGPSQSTPSATSSAASSPSQVEIKTDAERRGTLILFPDRLEYRDEGKGSSRGHGSDGPDSDNNFSLSCAEIRSVNAYGLRPVLIGSHQVVITARNGKYHIPALHGEPIVQEIQNRCGAALGEK